MHDPANRRGWTERPAPRPDGRRDADDRGAPLPLAHEELIESRIELHDSNQFEVKLDYSIDPLRRHNRYSVEAYFFVPRSLGITSYTYSRDQFYSDIQAYIRFKTPSVSLAALIDDANPDSVLRTLGERLKLALRDSRNTAALDTTSRELRLLGCLVRANVRDRVELLTARLRELRAHGERGPAMIADFTAETEQLLSELAAVIARLRRLRTSFDDPVLPGWLREAYAYVDEYLSLVVELHLTSLLGEVDRASRLRGTLTEMRRHITDLILSERRHREAVGYDTVLTRHGAAERYVYKSGLLKKFASSVLFLEMSKQREGQRRIHIVAGLAAGLAMLFATVMSIVAQSRYGINSIAFVVALVATYILKDRIKEGLKQYFSAKMTRSLADYNTRIRDPETGRVVGRYRESFWFLPLAKVPRAIVATRHHDAASIIETESKPEVCMKYAKEVVLDGRVVAEHYRRFSDINDILRFNLAHFLVRTDDPVRVVRHYDPSRDRVGSVHCPKVYHLNIVFVFRANGSDSETREHVRVVFDKRGIRKVEAA